MDLIKIAEEAFATPKKEFDSFGPGDTVTVAYRIKEGNKARATRSVSLYARFQTVSALSVSSRWNLLSSSQSQL